MNSVADIALLVGVPSREADFHARIRQQSSDFLRKYAFDPQRSWEQIYSGRIAAPIQLMVQRAQQLGVQVTANATLADLTAASHRAAVVVVYSHWKGYEVIQDDDRSGGKWGGFVERLRKDDPRACVQWLQKHLRKANPAMVLHRFVKDGIYQCSRVEPAGFTELASELTEQSEAREFLDGLFEGLLWPGNRLELAGGLHSCDEVSSSLAPQFAGLLDLTTCSSSLLADHLDRQHGAAFRLVQFRQEVNPRLSSEALRLSFDLMVEHGLSYVEARRLSEGLIEQQFRQALST